MRTTKAGIFLAIRNTTSDGYEILSRYLVTAGNSYSVPNRSLITTAAAPWLQCKVTNVGQAVGRVGNIGSYRRVLYASARLGFYFLRVQISGSYRRGFSLLYNREYHFPAHVSTRRGLHLLSIWRERTRHLVGRSVTKGLH